MWLYYTLIVYIIAIAILLNSINLKNKKGIYLFMVFSILIILASLRDKTIGNDTHVYMNLFTKLQNIKLEYYSDRYEIGYLFLNKFVGIFSKNPQSILVTTSIIILSSYSRFIKRYSKNVYVSTILFFLLGYFGSSMNTLRHQLAIVILFFSYKYIREKKFMKFILVVIMASLFHNTAIIFLIAYPVSKLKVNLKVIVCFMAMTVLVYTLFAPIFKSLLSKMEKYSYYLNSVYLNGEVRLATIINILISLSIILFGLILIKRNKVKLDNDIRIMTMFLITGISISIISLKFNLLDRVAEYFQIFSIIYLPNVINLIKVRERRYIYIILIIVLFLLYSLSIQYFRPDWNRIFPYKIYKPFFNILF